MLNVSQDLPKKGKKIKSNLNISLKNYPPYVTKSMLQPCKIVLVSLCGLILYLSPCCPFKPSPILYKSTPCPFRLLSFSLSLSLSLPVCVYIYIYIENICAVSTKNIFYCS